MAIEYISCPDCKDRLGIVLRGPHRLHLSLLVKLVHFCDDGHWSTQRLHVAIFGSAEELLEQILDRARASHRTGTDTYHAIASYAEQALLALRQRRQLDEARAGDKALTTLDELKRRSG